jgi:GNAT superfamily N-acetyltransferase
MSKNVKIETGILQAFDKHKKPILFEGSPVILEWHKTTDHATMVEIQKKALPVLAEAFADEVKNFFLDEQFQIKKEYAFIAERRSDDTSKQDSGENPFIANARLDREKRVEFSRQGWEHWFENTAQAMKDIPCTYFFVMAKSNKGEILGVVAFYISPMLTRFFPDFAEYIEGDVLLEPIAITQAAQGHGLSRPLVFSILTLAPEIKRILVGTRIWITPAITMYKALGFSEYKREGVGVKFIYVVKN